MSTKDGGGDDEWPAAAKGGARRRTCEDDEWPAAKVRDRRSTFQKARPMIGLARP